MRLDDSSQPEQGSDGFLSRGVTRAALNTVGNVLEVSKAFIICVTAGVRVGVMD